MTTALFLLCLAANGAEPTTVFNVAQPRAIPAGAPRASDVIMRSLVLRRASATSSLDTMQALADFHVSRLEWAYINDPAFIAAVKAKGILFGGAASAPSYLAGDGRPDWQEVCIVDLEGKIVIASWKRTWRPTLWGCVNNPDYEAGYLAYLREYIDAGVDLMQRDEPEANHYAVNWGACFCDHCMAGFRGWLGEHTSAAEQRELGLGELAAFDYRAHLRAAGAPAGDEFRRWPGGRLKELFTQFQLDSTVAFHERTRLATDAMAGRRVPTSCNNGGNRWDETRLPFDWAFGELHISHATPEFLLDAMRQAAARDRLQVVTMPKSGQPVEPRLWERLTRQTIAYSYAAGGYCMVPWDVFMPSDQPRYFGTTAQYADLFAFIRDNASYLDGYEEAAATGGALVEPRYGSRPPVGVERQDQIHAVVRVVPGQPDRPAVVHLVDWSAEPAPSRLWLDPAAWFGDRPIRLRLRVPGDGGTRETVLAAGRPTSVELPALTPWGMVVVEPLPAAAGLWPPVVGIGPHGAFRADLPVTLRAPFGGTVRYTLDGTQPTAASPAVRDGLVTVTDSATITARVFAADGQAGPAEQVAYERLPGSAGLPPDAPGLRDALRLWLRADDITTGDGTLVPTWPARVGPDLTVPEGRLPAGEGRPVAPTLVRDWSGERAAVRFSGGNEVLAAAGFANQHLAGRDFTVFVVSRSGDGEFGVGGNGLTGSGGIPRLYLTRSDFIYDQLGHRTMVRAGAEEPTVACYQHDGRETISAWLNDRAPTHRAGVAAVAEFGSGGNLAVPLWGGDRPHAGDLAALVVYDRALAEAEREAVTRHLALWYQLPVWRLWR